MEQKTGRKKNTLLNTGSSILLQIVTGISGLILPRLLISVFGSEVNGICASITQFLGYISLLQAGVEGVFRASLYRPLSEKNMEKVSGIVNEAKGFYRKIALIFIPYVVGLCILYPIFVESSYDKIYLASLVLILSLGTFLQYYFSLSYISLISADQKVRIIYLLEAVVIVLNLVVSIVLIKIGLGIHWVKIGSCLVFAIKPAFYGWYVKKNYKLVKNAVLSKNEVKQKWNGLVHHIAYFIHTNIDIFLLTLFVNTKAVSVYAVYYSVTASVEKIINSISSGANASIGNLLVTETKEKINEIFDKYEFIQSAVITVLLSITAILIVPFVKVYTKGITDAQYIQPLFAYILVLSVFLYCMRCIYTSVIQNAGKFKETQVGAIIECALNLVISVALVFKFNLVGIAIGTACGMGSRLIYEVIFLKKNVLYRPISKTVKMFLVNILLASILVVPSIVFIRFEVTTFIQWIVYAIIVSVCCIAIAIAIYMLFYRKLLIDVLKGIKRFIFKTKNITKKEGE